MKWKPTLSHLAALDWAPARGTLVLSGAALLAGMTVLFGWVDWLALGRWARPHAVPLALFAAASAGLTAAGWRLRGQHPPRTRVSGMNWWIFAAAAIVVVVVAWTATGWLLTEAAAAKDPGVARVEAIKTGLGIGAGTTGIFALLLAVRRQWHSESDATEKNVTELYTKAADQLGSAEAPVRMAGLYALERLAHNNPGQRQSIVNVICAYLRMPYTPPEATDGPEPVPAQQQERIQQREVRLAAQRILTDHLNPRDRWKFWDNIDLDLTSAHLIDFTLTNCQARSARFSNATLTGDTWFEGATFTGDASFNDTMFTGSVSLQFVTFAGDTWFNRGTFTSDTWFEGATFTGGASFYDTKFTGDLFAQFVTFADDSWFEGATFARYALWDGATFTNARFGEVTFGLDASFGGVTFAGEATFSDTTFMRGASFGNAAFTGDAWFDGATFVRGASFGHATFASDASFASATFADEAYFKHVTMNGQARFDRATFTGPLPVIERRLAEKAVLTGAIITDYSPDRPNVAGIVVEARGAQVPPDEGRTS